MGGVGVGTCWAGGTEASTVGVIADETGAAVLAVVNVTLSGCSELPERARLASIAYLVVICAGRALVTGAATGKGVPSVSAYSAFVIGAARAVAGTGIGTFGKGQGGAKEEQQPAQEEPHRGSIVF